MENLLNLLNEYAPDYCKNYPDDIIMDEVVISKRFGFIKRLVEKNKIDTSYKKHWENRPYKLHQFSGKAEKYSSYDTILMLLSISDTPIDDLISYLK